MSQIQNLLMAWNIEAVLFDLDGTMIDNNEFHLRSWREYIKDIGKNVSEEDYLAHINGRTNKDAVQYIYGREMSDEEAMKYALEKEAIYRRMFAPYIKPVNGLLPMLDYLNRQKLPMAIATSGIQVNIDFMFEHLPVKQYFSAVINSSHIKNGKPDPEIYLVAASTLNVDPRRCLVFEDAVVGIKAAQSAGMKVIALTTTHSAAELSKAEKIVRDFSDLL